MIPAASSLLNYAGDTASVSITAGAGCPWSVTNTNSWMTITSADKGTGNGTVSYSVTANNAVNPRSGTIIIANQPYLVSQAGNPNQSGGTCTYSVTPDKSPILAGTGGTGTITVTTQSGCAWSVTRLPGWVSLTSASSGTGSATISYSVASNPTANARIDEADINSMSTYVQQNGNMAYCTYSISPGGPQTLSSAAQQLQVSVTTQQGFTWSTTGNNTMRVKVLSSSYGTNGAGNVLLSISANTVTTARSNTFTIAGQSITINQAKKGQ